METLRTAFYSEPSFNTADLIEELDELSVSVLEVFPQLKTNLEFHEDKHRETINVLQKAKISDSYQVLLHLLKTEIDTAIRFSCLEVISNIGNNNIQEDFDYEVIREEKNPTIKLIWN